MDDAVEALLGEVRARIERGDSQADIAALLGVEQTTVSRWLSGKVRPRRSTAVAALARLRLPADQAQAAEALFVLFADVLAAARELKSASGVEAARAIEQLTQSALKLEEVVAQFPEPGPADNDIDE